MFLSDRIGVSFVLSCFIFLGSLPLKLPGVPFLLPSSDFLTPKTLRHTSFVTLAKTFRHTVFVTFDKDRFFLVPASECTLFADKTQFAGNARFGNCHNFTGLCGV